MNTNIFSYLSTRAGGEVMSADQFRPGGRRPGMPVVAIWRRGGRPHLLVNRSRLATRDAGEVRQPAELPARRIEVGRIEPLLVGSSKGRPFGVDDRIPRRIAVATLGDGRL